MEIEFEDPALQELYEGKKPKEKRFKSNPTLVKQYVKTVNKLCSVDKIEDLFLINSLEYEKLTGDRQGHSSVRINDQFRIIFSEIASETEPFEIVLLSIEEVSNHYSK